MTITPAPANPAPIRTASRTGSQRRPVARGALTLSSALLVALIGAANHAQSATFVVDSTADVVDATPGDGVCDTGTGACTLRAAIRETNALAGADVIELPAGTYVLSIAGISEDSAVTGDLDVRDDLTITGAGSAVTVIDANGIDRVFECPLTGAPHSVEISDLTVQHGDATGSGLGYGGGIAVSSNHSNVTVTLTLDDVVLAANTAVVRGCGLWIQGQNHGIIRDSVIRDHDCQDVAGAGIHINGTAEIVGSSFHDNIGSVGGALRVYACSGPGTIEIRETSFLNNTSMDGGAIYSNCYLTVRDSIFAGNHAIIVGYSGGIGGAIDSSRSLWIYDSIFSGNSADSIAGAIQSGGSSGTFMEMARCLFTGNTALYYAAGAFLGSGQYLLSDSTFSGNECGDATFGEGCAVYTAALPQVTIDNCTFANNQNNFGGSTALEVYNGTVTVGHSIFAGGTGGPSCGGTLLSTGHNIDSGTSCGLASIGDQSSTDPLLGPLADNSGPSWTHLALPGSPAIDGGDPTGVCTTNDQRGVQRPVDGDGDGGSECDIGAVEVAALADLAIAKDDGQTSAVPGSSTVYSLTVSNAGPDDVTGAVVSDPFDDPPFDRSQVTWTCASDPGAGVGTTCPTSGTGNDLAAGVIVDVEAAASLTFTATAPIRPDATGTLENTATVVSGSTTADLNPDNDASTDEEPLTPEADLRVDKDDGVDFVLLGGSLTYVVDVVNDGPSDDPLATLTDVFPVDLDCTWTCVPSGNATCPSGPVSGDIDATVSLPAGDSATFTAECAVLPTAIGSIVNTANIASSPGVSDPEPANDTDGDTTTVRLLDFGDAPDPSYPTLTANNGARHGIAPGFYLGGGVDSDDDGQPTSNADGDDLDGVDDEDGVSFTSGLGVSLDASVDVTASAGGLLNAWVDFNSDGDWLDAGEHIFTDHPVTSGVNPLTFSVPATATLGATYARFRLDSSGGLAPDGVAADGEVEDELVEIVTGADLEVSLDASADPAPSGHPLTWTLTVTNNGPLDATSIILTDTLPAEAIFLSSTPGSPDCSFSIGTLTCDLGTLAPHASAQTTIDVVLDHPVWGHLSNTVAVSASEGDPIPGNDSDTLATTIGLFLDDFEIGDTSAWN